MRDLFADWLSEFDRGVQRQGRRVLLGMDNFTAHHVQSCRTAVTLLFLPPNTISKVQPLEFGIMPAFKASYRARAVERLVIAVDRPAANLPLRGSLYSADSEGCLVGGDSHLRAELFPQGRLRRNTT
ncbi:hypothetical protein HPB48_000601 [Haemaphysalis longicornis]|uniref:DDE-1 domain-containing protein n=1 Tax=Haemaphysalis longicornis TaxID=44386 RepID=A0A9J6GIZ2_HAELO|nr:hypothetical protein HPB48_000601 [Haemaphysalis longicornis]